MLRLYCPGIGVLPGPATGSHIVNRGTSVLLIPLGHGRAVQLFSPNLHPAWRAAGGL